MYMTHDHVPYTLYSVLNISNECIALYGKHKMYPVKQMNIGYTIK